MNLLTYITTFDTVNIPNGEELQQLMRENKIDDYYLSHRKYSTWYRSDLVQLTLSQLEKYAPSIENPDLYVGYWCNEVYVDSPDEYSEPSTRWTRLSKIKVIKDGWLTFPELEEKAKEFLLSLDIDKDITLEQLEELSKSGRELNDHQLTIAYIKDNRIYFIGHLTDDITISSDKLYIYKEKDNYLNICDNQSDHLLNKYGIFIDGNHLDILGIPRLRFNIINGGNGIVIYTPTIEESTI